MSASLYWYDYETFGTHPAYDRPAQFAGVRTTPELEVIGQPLEVYTRLTADYLPDPGACRVTGIGPAIVNEQGLNEKDFITRIKSELSQPGTCNTGYNSIRFDDEFTRHTLFRNFHDPYEHEWRDGNSRWDLLDVVRLTRALRPQGINWPFHTDGKPSNRLEDLTRANGIEHGDAHDATSDVYATIAVARLIRQHQPKLFDYAYRRRDKSSIATLLNLVGQQPVLHVSGMIPSDFGHTAMVLPLARHPKNKNGIIVIDLRYDPEPLMSLTPAELAHRLFTPKARQSAGQTPVGIKTIHINRAPVVVPLSTLDEESAARLFIDTSVSFQHAETIKRYPEFAQSVVAAMSEQSFEDPDDVDNSLYSGGFFSESDRRQMQTIRGLNAAELGTFDGFFDDARMDEMLFRYRARNFPASLSAAETQRWHQHVQQALNKPAFKLPSAVSGEHHTDDGKQSLRQRFERAMEQTDWAPEEKTLQAELAEYAAQHQREYNLDTSSNDDVSL